MLVHVGPHEEDLCETLCTLNFATRVKRVQLRNEESTVSLKQSTPSTGICATCLFSFLVMQLIGYD